MLRLLDGPAADLVRRDATFEELDVGERAIIARPSELILDLLDG